MSCSKRAEFWELAQRVMSNQNKKTTLGTGEVFIPQKTEASAEVPVMTNEGGVPTPKRLSDLHTMSVGMAT